MMRIFGRDAPAVEGRQHFLSVARVREAHRHDRFPSFVRC